VATVVLKRLSDALAAGDPVRAVIRETLLNQDGKTETITLPNESAQEALIRESYRKAGLNPRDTQYFEAHGTGTPMGDPIEARALAAVFQPGRPPDEPLRIGSVKTNVGHTEATSGLAGLIKAALAVEHGFIPPTINFSRPNPKLDLKKWNLKVALELEKWPNFHGGPRRASINNFGYGGTNSHVILESCNSYLGQETHGNAAYNGPHLEWNGAIANGTNGHIDGNANGVNGHLNGGSKSHPESNGVVTNGVIVNGTNGYANGNLNGEINGTNSHLNGSSKLALPSNGVNTNGLAAHQTDGHLKEDQKSRLVSNGVATNGIIGSLRKDLPTSHDVAILVLSGRDEQACRRMVSNLKDSLELKRGTKLETREFIESLVYTLAQRRSLFPWIATHPVPVSQGLDGILQALDSPKFKPSRTSRLPKIGMVFTGQGAQWNAMGRELMKAYPVFKKSIEEAEEYLRHLGADWSLMEELSRDAESTRVNETNLSIPICVALQISLIHLLRAWCIRPCAVTSHSSGEIAAAYTVGAISYRAAMGIAYYRAVLAADKCLRGSVQGGMLAIGVGLDDAEIYLKRLGDDGKVVVACINSPSSVTIAGDVPALAKLEQMAKEDGVFARRLRVETAYHSHHMNPIVDTYRKALREIPLEDLASNVFDSIAFSSPVTGSRITSAEEIADAEHWVESLLQPVQFVDAFSDMVLGDFDSLGAAVDVVVEVGPHTALGGPIRQILELPQFSDIHLPYFGCLVRNKNARETMQVLVSNLMREGYPVDLGAVNFPFGNGAHMRVLTDLPSYPWNHQTRHWHEPRFNKALKERSQPPHEFLGSLVEGTNLDAPSWRCILRTGDSPWVADHAIQSNAVYPGAGYICLAIEAIRQLTVIKSKGSSADTLKDVSGYRLRDIDISQALVVPDHSDGIEVQTLLRPVSDKDIGTRGWMHFEVFSITGDNKWTQHAKGLVSTEFDKSTGTSKDDMRDIEGHTKLIDPGDLFAHLRTMGIHHGPKFQNLKTIVQSGSKKEMRSVVTLNVADTSLPDDLPPNYLIHPTTLDAVITAAYSALPGVSTYDCTPKIPRNIDSIWMSSKISREVGHQFKSYTSLSRGDTQSMEGNVVVADCDGTDPVLEINGILYQSMGKDTATKHAKPWENELCSKVEWALDISLASPTTLASIQKQLNMTMEKDEVALNREFLRICTYFIQDALRAITLEDMERMEPHQACYYAWMERQLQLASSGQLSPDSATWILDPVSERERRISLAANYGAHGQLICHLGPKLAAFAKGEKVPIEEMSKDNLLSRWYSDVTKIKRQGKQFSGVLRHVVHKSPRARILEIGAGTGTITSYALKVLGTTESGGPQAASYHFTDISAGFFEAARKRFLPWTDLITFDVLDIEQDPTQQGFALESYDIIIACDVLHATKSMNRTLKNVRSLLRPGGTLLLTEEVRYQGDIQFIFGLLPGWWLSQEPERQLGPLLTIPLWDRFLRDAGFTGVDLEILDCDNAEEYTSATIMSTVPLMLAPELASSQIVIVTGSNPPPSSWLESLRNSIATDPNKGGNSPLPLVQDLASASTATAASYGGKICIFIAEVNQPVLHNLDSESLEAIRAMATGCKGLLWVTRGGAVDCEIPELSMTAGFLRALRNEYVGRKLLTLDLDPNTTTPWSDDSALAIVKVLKTSFSNSGDTSVIELAATDFEYAERRGTILVPRICHDVARNKLLFPESSDTIPDGPFYQKDRPLRMHVGIPGLLDTLAFGDHPDAAAFGNPVPSSLIEVEPRAYGVNFRDVMVAMGQLNESVMGLEGAGVITRLGTDAVERGYSVGDRVLFMSRGLFFSSRVMVECNMTARLPADMSFQEAASLPIVFVTAYYSLVQVARLQRGQSILIHAAAGGVGQAAIMLAKHLGAEIFATVSGPEKRQLIIDKYGIASDHIFNSRDTSFGPATLAATKGRGVDVVLNSLAGPLLQESFNVLAPLGQFIEIGKRDLEQNNRLEMGPFARHASFSAIDLLRVLEFRPSDISRCLDESMQLLNAKVIAPIQPVTSYPIGDIAKSFRLLQTGRHLGKVVLSTDLQETVPLLPRLDAASFRPDASYLIVGGTGGLGRVTAHWMVSHGVQNLVLMSRSAESSEKAGHIVEELRRDGCRVLPISCDVASAQDLDRALLVCKQEGFPPIRGVIHATLSLHVSDYQYTHRTLTNIGFRTQLWSK
jgi:acyl transferase domain-containing protein/NADPH:quinone reductase-like Zn-dependent oxidoreductase/SAM-dependent methyltransferase